MYEEIKEKLKKTLSSKRYKHSIGVADESRKLAEINGADTDKAYLAGLLHDCAKEINTVVQIRMCAEMNITIDDIIKTSPGLIHGILGAEIARVDYGICDEEILGAIRWHTIGKADMTLLEKIVYIADMTERNRNFEGVEELRAVVYSDLNKGILLSISQHIKLLEKRGAVIHPNTILLQKDLIKNERMKEGD